MSTRGGYGFVLNGQEKIIYVGNGAEFGGLGDTVLCWLRGVTAGAVNEQAAILKQIDNLKEAPVGTVPEDVKMSILAPDTNPISAIANYEWHSLLRQISYDPQNVLDLGYYLDASWLINSVDCEYLYMIDFDKDVFEIYRDTHIARNLPASGRFNARAKIDGITTRRDAAYINMITSYSFDTLPESIGHLEDAIYEPEFWETSC